MPGRKAVIVLCILVSVVALFSTGWTMARWLASYRTIRQLDLVLREVRLVPGEDATFTAHIVLMNTGPVDVSIESLFVILQWRQKMIAFLALHPRDLSVPSQETVPLALSHRSNLAPGSLPPRDASPQDPAWSIKAHLVVRPATKQGVFRLSLERYPYP